MDPVLHVHPIPNDAVGTGEALSVAIRVWHWPYWATWYGGGPGAPSYLGEADRIDDEKWLYIAYYFRDRSSSNILLLVNLLAGVVGLAWFWSRRTEKEYLWCGLYGLMIAAGLLREDYWTFLDTSFARTNFLNESLGLLARFFLLLFTVSLVKDRRNWLFWLPVSILAIRYLLTYPTVMGWTSAPVMYASWFVALFPLQVCILVFLVRGVRRGDRDSRLLIAPMGLLLVKESYEHLVGAL